MATQQELMGILERAAHRAEDTSDGLHEVLVSEGEKDVTLSDGTVTPNLNKRIKLLGSQVTSVVGKKGDITISDISEKLELGSASKYDVADLPISAAQKVINDKIVSVVESIADLIAIKKPKDGQVVFVKSYWSGWATEAAYRGPIGGGYFIFDAKQAAKSDGGLVVSGWVRQWENYIKPEYFGAKGDGTTDDYLALTKCFTSIADLPETIYDANHKLWTASGATFWLDSAVYRITQPLRMPAMSNVISGGEINYFVSPLTVTSKAGRPTIFYDGADLNVSAIYLPSYINQGDGTWKLNNDSLHITTAGDAAERCLAVGCNYRFNIVTKRNTYIGANLFGFESGTAELGVGTMGTYSKDQTEAQALQSTDYDYDDFSPVIGIVLEKCWNSKLIRPRVISHKIGVYVGKSSAKTVIDTPYINRQLDKASDAASATPIIPAGMSSDHVFTTAFMFDSADVTLIAPVAEYWGTPYVMNFSTAKIIRPHVEGSNLLMKHDFVVRNSKITVDGWSNIRTMYAREGTSIVYSYGMRRANGDFVDMIGAGYYGDNSAFNLVDGIGYNTLTNCEFLRVANIPYDKLIGAMWMGGDSRYLKTFEGIGVDRFDLYVRSDYVSPTLALGVSANAPIPTLYQASEAIRLLGKAFTGNIILLSNAVIQSSRCYLKSEKPIYVDLGGFKLTLSGQALSPQVSKLSFQNGTLAATGTNALIVDSTPLENLVFSSNVTINTTNYLLRSEASNHNLNMYFSGTNLTAMQGKYAGFVGIGSANIVVKSTTRPVGFDEKPIDGDVVVNKLMIN